MKYILISNMYPSKKYPGYGTFVKNICDGLNKIGMSMVGKAIIKGKSINKVSKIFSYFKLYTETIYCFIFKKYDFIYIHYPNLVTPILQILYKIKRPPLIVNFHGGDLDYIPNKLDSYLGKLTYKFCKKCATGIVVPSEFYKEIALNKKIIDNNLIIVSPSAGIDLKTFFYENKPKNNKLHIGFVGRLEKDKGYLNYLNVCLYLKQTKIDFNATIIGNGTGLNEVKEFIQVNNLTDKITMIESVEQSKLGSYYRSFDLLIFCSKRETLGLVGIESMACGTPVIGSDIGGITSYLTNNYNGWIIPLQKPEMQIVQHILNYTSLSDKDILTIRNNCIKTAEKYERSLVCSELYDNINKILCKH